ncbi:YcaO-like family protein [Streptomyces sp. NPDC002784]
MDNAHNVPVCAANIWSVDYPIVFAGSGCHFDPAIALSWALTEAAQSRLTCIAGTRDDLDSHEGAFAASPPRPLIADLPTGDWNTLTHNGEPEHDDLDVHLPTIAASVAGVTGYEPVVFTFHDAEAVAAVKVVSPGLEMRIIRSILALEAAVPDAALTETDEAYDRVYDAVHSARASSSIVRNLYAQARTPTALSASMPSEGGSTGRRCWGRSGASSSPERAQS